MILSESHNARVVPGKNEDEKVKQLAVSLLTRGQIQPIVITADGYLLVGSRRTKAGLLIESGAFGDASKPAFAKKYPAWPGGLRYLVSEKSTEVAEDDTFGDTLAENIQREQFNGMTMLANIQRVRREKGWDGPGFKNTQAVAKYLGISPAAVTEIEKLAGLPDEIQAQVAAGEISNQTALELARVKDEHIKQVAKEAQALANREAREKAKAAKSASADEAEGTQASTEGGEAVVLPENGMGDTATAPAAGENDAPESGDNARVTAGHVQSVIDQKAAAGEDVVKTHKKRTTKQLGEAFGIFIGSPAYPEVISRLFEFLRDEFMQSTEYTERQLRNRVDAVAALVEQSLDPPYQKAAREAKAAEEAKAALAAKKAAKANGGKKNGGGKKAAAGDTATVAAGTATAGGAVEDIQASPEAAEATAADQD